MSAACAFARGSRPSSLHPTIDIDAPLVFDVYDRWTGRAVAGCTYHVAHPGGRNFEHFPVNSNEAESRRLSRFFPYGHSVGPQPEPRVLVRPENSRTRWTCVGVELIDAASDRGEGSDGCGLSAAVRTPTTRCSARTARCGRTGAAFIDGLTAMGGEGRMHAAETAARMLHDNDVTYVAQGTRR